MRVVFLLSLLLSLGGATVLADPLQKVEKMSERYPYLCSGALRYAQLAELEQGIIATWDGFSITQKDLDKEVAKSPNSLREQMEKYQVYVLDQVVTKGLVLHEAAQWAKNNKSNTPSSEQALIERYLWAQIPPINATDQEVEQFYRERLNMFVKTFGDAPYDSVQGTIKAFYEEERRQEAQAKFASLAGQRHEIVVSTTWIKKQVEVWAQNPVEHARVSGKPSFVNFGVIGCCDTMYPIIEAARAEYGERLKVVFVHVGENPVLSDSYGISTIPVQIFFDKAGKEASRHVGPLSKEQVAARIAELGVN